MTFVLKSQRLLKERCKDLTYKERLDQCVHVCVCVCMCKERTYDTDLLYILHSFVVQYGPAMFIERMPI